MNRAEFMRQLERLLQNIPLAEREEALQYYNDYFNDAGEENEKDVIAALGTPARVAENIKRGLGNNEYDGSSGERRSGNRYAVTEYDSAQKSGEAGKDKEKDGKKELSGGMIALIIVLSILMAPIIFGVGSGLIGVLFSVVAAWFGLIVGFGLAAIILFCVLAILVVAGFSAMFSGEIIAGIGILGGGLICGGLAILFLMLTVAMSGIATPAIFRGIAGLCRRIFGKQQLA